MLLRLVKRLAVRSRRARWECLNCGLKQTYDQLDRRGNCAYCHGPVVLTILLSRI